MLITPDGILNGGGRLFFDWTNITSRYEQRRRETAMMADNHGHLALKQNYKGVAGRSRVVLAADEPLYLFLVPAGSRPATAHGHGLIGVDHRGRAPPA